MHLISEKGRTERKIYQKQNFVGIYTKLKL